jgi:two-component system, OmpR family, response regulator RegX3
MRVLLAEDDPDMLDVTTYALRKHGYDVEGVTSGTAAVARWQMDAPDLVLLDLNLPGMSGMDVCRTIRERSTTPVIIVTAHGDEDHVVEGFESGADDFVSKPVSYKELAMRMRAVLQRSVGAPVIESSVVEAAGITVDLQSLEVTLVGSPIRMTRLEARVLYCLIANAGHAVTSSRLIEFVWQYDGGDAFSLKTHISHIRQKLGIKRGEAGFISSLHQIGYVLQIG